MDEKISLEAIALYADSYSEKVTKGYFLKKDKISGSEILTFCNVSQVNLMIIKELFRSWKEETRKVKSPYFDYEKEEVKEAMDNLMNVLSQNILISQQHFAPLVKKAVSQTLMVVFDPYDYYSMLITGKNNKVEVSAFKEEIKYLKVNKAPLERMLAKMEEKKLSEISGNEALGILDAVLEEVNFTPEDVEEYIEKFSIVAPLDPGKFFIPEAQVSQVTMPPPPSERVESSTPTNKVNQPKVVSQPVVNASNNQNVIPLVNESPIRESRPTLADNFHRNRKIKESLTINQKFMFTKVLFHGDFELFTKAIDRVDQFDNLSSALRYLEDEHASTWDRESEEFHEFMEMVERRFA
jgi:hypothetical protein